MKEDVHGNQLGYQICGSLVDDHDHLKKATLKFLQEESCPSSAQVIDVSELLAQEVFHWPKEVIVRGQQVRAERRMIRQLPARLGRLSLRQIGDMQFNAVLKQDKDLKKKRLPKGKLLTKMFTRIEQLNDTRLMQSITAVALRSFSVGVDCLEGLQTSMYT
ncbi:hypothetical protein KIN20_011270 [Parelaphostrongylus tenuis]|uniref:Uncharacterized protein n=1 Tax=Parelaphostrongylus tenuis TaxID=148309 RepID=A0AAD5QPR2_PARTN|nr:hypothetical protein KIN20_011270 [Parelaphostrongylus tenuis]